MVNDAAKDAHLRSVGPAWIAELLAKRCAYPSGVKRAATAAAKWLRSNPGLHDDSRHFKDFNVEAPVRNNEILRQLCDIMIDIERRATAAETTAAIIEVCCSAMRNIRDTPQ